MNCRHCNTNLKNTFVDLISSPPSNSFVSKDSDKFETYYPLKVYVCENCYLVQLDEFKSALEIFNDEYVYFSSFSTSWLEHAKNYANYVSKRFNLTSKSQVIEIASNDGYLLQYFKELSIPVLGIEPTGNTAKIAQEKGIETIVKYFDSKFASQLVEKNICGDLIIGNNVLAHVPNINDFLLGVKTLMSKEGVTTFEFPHLLELIKFNQFDTIYHEHFSYLSLYTVKRIANSLELEVFDVEQIPTHGGSLRVFLKHKDSKHEVTKNVEKVLTEESTYNLTQLAGYSDFQEKCEKVKFDFISKLIDLKRNGHKVAGYGAAAKGNTLLNYCGIKNDLIEFVADLNPHKQGKLLPGSNIPVVSEEHLKSEKPDFIVIFPWNLKEEIIFQLNYARDWGAKFIIAIPEIKVL